MKIKLSKSQWEFMGKKAGWMKKANLISEAIQQIQYLMQKEKEYSANTGDISAMEEATDEDIDAGYGRGMSANDYKDSLFEPRVEVLYMGNDNYGEDFKIYFHGNNAPSSVNAGRPSKHFIDQVTLEGLQEFIAGIKAIQVNGSPDLDLSEKTQAKLPKDTVSPTSSPLLPPSFKL